jgi:phosphate transport system substrate-binding protein
VAFDGSSTVFPITEAAAEEFGKTGKGSVTVGVSGTGGGFKKLCAGEIDFAGASRPMKATEVEQCKAKGIETIELPVAYDGLAVVVNPQNDWADHVTVEELRLLWAPEAQGKIQRWSDVRKGWPAEEIHLFGAGVDSGTYDYFTAAIVGTEHASRGDYTSSEDDNVLVQGVGTDKQALGFMGFAYYTANKDKLKVLSVDDGKAENGDGPIAPSPATVRDATYQPLSRPLFIYVAKAALERPAALAFAEFYLAQGAKLAEEVGFIPLPEAAQELARKRLADRVTGSMFEGTSQVGVSIEALLAGK